MVLENMFLLIPVTLGIHAEQMKDVLPMDFPPWYSNFSGPAADEALPWQCEPDKAIGEEGPI